MTTIIPLTQTAIIVNSDGSLTPQFKLYLDSLLLRAGGVTGGSYNALAVNSGAFIWDLNADPVAVVVLQNGVNVLSPPLNQVAGLLYRLTIIQPASGAPGTISWPRPPFLFPGAITPSLSTASNAIDELIFDSDPFNLKLVVEAINLS